MPASLSARLPAPPPGGILARRIGAALAVAALVIAADQISKYVVVDRMNLRELGGIDVAPPFLNFRMAWNTGVNFGLLSSHAEASRWGLIVFATLLSVALLAATIWQERRVRALGLGVAAGGAIGNLIDRFHYGAVADFLNVSGFGIRNPWSFNVADVAVFAGFALLLWPLPKKRAANP